MFAPDSGAQNLYGFIAKVAEITGKNAIATLCGPAELEEH